MLIPNNLVMIVTKMENGCSSLSEQRESERERKRETKKFPRLRLLQQEMPHVFKGIVAAKNELREVREV